LTCRQAPLHLSGWQVEAVAVVPGGLALTLLALPQLLQPFLGAEAGVRVVAVQKRPRGLGVAGQALGLDVGSVGPADRRPVVPAEPQPAQALHDRVQAARDDSVAVGVLDAQDEGAAVMAG